MRYCDGFSFTGGTEEPYNYTFSTNENPTRAGRTITIHRRGHAILGAVIDDLIDIGLSEASELVVGGCSAGGLAAYQHCDRIADEMAKHGSARVSCLPDAGYFSTNPAMENWMMKGAVRHHRICVFHCLCAFICSCFIMRRITWLKAAELLQLNRGDACWLKIY